MSLRRLGISNYHLFWRRHVESTSANAVIQQFLPQFLGDPSAMRDLRAMLEESTLEIPNNNLTDEDVLFGIARLLASGELIVVREWSAHGGSGTQPDKPNPAPPPASSPGPAGGSNSPGPEDPTLPADTAAAAQAATLAAAADSGAPFCDH